jgi:hypothetical protein
MADEIKSEFSQQVVEPPQLSEYQLVQQRIQNYTIGINPNNAQTISTILEVGLQKGNFKLSELDSLVSIREEVNQGLIEYNTQVQVAQRRLQELQEEETAKIVAEREKQQQQLLDNMAGERQRRKSAEERLSNMEAVLLSHGISMDLNADGKIGLVEGQKQVDLTDDEKSQVNSIVQVEKDNIATQPNLQPKPKVPGKTSPAFAVARAMNPVVEEDTPQVEVPKQTFKEWEEPVELELDVPTDAKGTKEFFEEVDRVESEVDELDQVEMDLIDEEQFNESFVSEEDFTEEEKDFLDEELSEEDIVEELKVAEEDTTTTPTFPITGGNAPNLKGQIPAPQKVSAVYDSEEELLKAVQDKIDAKKEEEAEEEYDEIIIPSSDELEGMTKKKIEEVSKDLGFNVSTKDTKEDMIQSFQDQTQKFIADLQDSGEFVNSTEQGDNENDDVRDGGYF